MKEQWKDIDGYKGVYQVSNAGKVRSLDRYTTQARADGSLYQRIMKGRLLSLNKTNGTGYHIVSLSNGHGSISKNFYIHILVATYFIDNPSNKSEVNHKDGDKSNNGVDNLEWVTHKENMDHAFDNGLSIWVSKKSYRVLRGSEVSGAKLTESQVMEIYKLILTKQYSDAEIAKKYNLISRESIRNIRRKKTWRHVTDNL